MLEANYAATLSSWAMSRVGGVLDLVKKECSSDGGRPFAWARENRPDLAERLAVEEIRVHEAFEKVVEDPSLVGEFEAACTAWKDVLMEIIRAYREVKGVIRAKNGQENTGMAGTAGLAENARSRGAAVFSIHPEAVLNPEIVLIASVEELRSALAEVAAAGVCGVDTETAGPGKKGGLDPHVGEVRLVQMAVPAAGGGVKSFVADMYRVKDFTPFWEFWNDHNILKVLHNAKFDLKFFRKHLGRRLPPARLFDTMLASQLLACGLDVGSHSLAACCRRFSGISLDKEERLSDWSSRELSESQIAYAARDAAVLLPLAAAEMKALAAEGLNRAAKIEFDAALPTSELEYAGIPFNRDLCRKLMEEEDARAAEIRAKLMQELAPALEQGIFGVREINPNSPSQLLPVLKALGVDVPNTMDDTLRLMYPDHPAVRALLEYRKCEKRLAAFLRPYLESVHPVTGRIHAEFVQINKNGVGRFSCRSPNLQQPPREKRFREVFAAPEGRKFVVCDYGQIELRIMAWLSKDAKMVEAYRKGLDLHTMTAAMTAGVSPEQVTKEMRQRAKACNFGMIYGMSARTFQQYAKTSYGVDMSEEEAAALREAFFRAYPGVAAWHRRQKAFAQANRFVRTVSGRKRKWPEGKDLPITQAYNTPDQGTGADILKTAMFYIYRDLFFRGWEDAVIVNSVHDEIILECPGDLAEEVAGLVKAGMEAAWYDLMGDEVPIEAEPVVGTSWADK
ncbi:DNA polymerase [Desulfofundulus sp.]|uniref:DNA polymerase n=1 Tax=Desulfofundulus sp. TaxID=2282750 RepID=UPI003C726177